MPLARETREKGAVFCVGDMVLFSEIQKELNRARALLSNYYHKDGC